VVKVLPTVNVSSSSVVSGAMAENGQMTMTLPAEITYVHADPAPLEFEPDLVWNVGDLPAGAGPNNIVLVGRLTQQAGLQDVLTITAGIACETPELENLNNRTDASLIVRSLVYLPIIQ
jgi:hypothetical protein